MNKNLLKALRQIVASAVKIEKVAFSKIKDQLHSLTLGEGAGSIMLKWLAGSNYYRAPETVAIAKVDDNIVGWAGVGLLGKDNPNKKHPGNFGLLQIFVMPEHRKKGIGKEVVKEALAAFKATNPKRKAIMSDEYIYSDLIEAAGFSALQFCYFDCDYDTDEMDKDSWESWKELQPYTTIKVK